MKEQDLKKIKAIAFDFGGTLDIPGIHWFDFFWSQFEGEIIKRGLTKEQYWDAYVYGERQMEKNGIPRDTSFEDTITRKLNYQFEYLAGHYNTDMIDQKLCTLTQIDANLQTAAMIFKTLNGNYDLSIVSNYYGNLETILKEAHIFEYLDRLIDSTIVGVRKPDPAIWKIAIDQSAVKPEEFLIIGDSMKNDILPAQLLGCPTILITKKLPPEEYKGAWVSSLEMLAKLLF
ncbi:HAD family hydrolase [Bacteroides sp. 51]|uniref:HAD family hydrolase n=1 Tax=Bacteroides sp. 51 TaxID=2302938 RepID=UPI0013D3B547|nr:HAD family hydrolase [Bacteroides sp. 51]NDV81852.1 HAD family hydrolase [Bacteroides sp. 51]